MEKVESEKIKIGILKYNIESADFTLYYNKTYITIANSDELFEYALINNITNLYAMKMSSDAPVIFDYLLRKYKWRPMSKNGAVKKGEFTAFINKTDVYSIKLKSETLTIKIFNVQKIKKTNDIESFYAFYTKEKKWLENKKSISSVALEEFQDNNHFKKMMPTLNKKIFENIRKAYKGGLCELNGDYKNQVLQDIALYDINSFYSYIMLECDLPVYKPFYCKIKKPLNIDTDKVCVIYHIYIDYEIMPERVNIVYSANDFFISSNRISDTKGQLIDLWLTDIELDYIKENYNVYEIEFIECYIFNKIKGETIFGDYIKKYYRLKLKYKKLNRQEDKEIAKGMLESLYGKFGANNHYKVFKPANVNGKVVYKYDGTIDTKGGYLPIAIYTTAYARTLLAGLINRNYKDFIYCDTDSIATRGSPDSYGIKIGDKIGQFKLEFFGEKARFIKPKTYYMENGESKKVVIAGVPKGDIEGITIDEFAKNKNIAFNKVCRTQGGVVYEKTKFKL